MRLVDGIKKPLRRLLDWQGARRAPARWASLEGSLLVLSYHRVLPRDFPELGVVEPGMYVFDDTFRKQMELLGEYFEPVDLAEWLRQREAGGDLPKRAAAITFDDGWRDNYEYAFPVLRELRLPATIFAVTGLAGTEYSFWPERLARRLEAAGQNAAITGSPWLDSLLRDAGVGLQGLDGEGVSRVIAVAKRGSDSDNHRQLDLLDERFGPVLPAEGRDLADWSELAAMRDSGCIRIGSHTRHHVRMNEGLSAAELEEQIVGSRREIEEKLGTSTELFCYPNGDITPAAAALVRENYRGACTTQNGWNTRATPAHEIRRVPLHEDRSCSPDAFLARIAGAL